MTRHQIVIEVDTSDTDPGFTAYNLMLSLADVAEDKGWLITDLFIREAPEES